LFLYGNSGLGKTHLMQSIAHYILQKDDKTNVLYVPSETFTNEIIEAIKNHTTNEFREKYRKVDVLLIDDVQFIKDKDSTQMEFFNTFNTLYNDKKQIILSSDRPPKEIKTLDERIISRFECGVPIDIHEPDYETRMAILKNKAEMDHLTGIPDEVFVYIAENVTNNIRELEGALNKISVYSKLMSEKVTLETAKYSLKDIINKDSNVTITPDLIIKTVSEHMGVSEDDIRSKKRSQDIATARPITMYLCRMYTFLSLKSIGNAVGGKDHSTVLNGIDRVEAYMQEDPSFKATIDTLVKKLNPNN
ncbi:MAG: chromosomal replication initiator protein DnaA, partial [Lachnospiraceae bacterium]|nr:chromosomal replication initiator protein DnaA [Lachnospiraceae bacterium]